MRRGWKRAIVAAAHARGRSVANVAQGAVARRAGRLFEAELEATHECPEYAERCAIARAHPPIGGQPGAMYHTGRGQVDFAGHVVGVPVAFDAKSNSDQASYKHDARDFHELDFLIRWRARGGVAFLLVLDRSIDTLYLVEDLTQLRAGKSVQLRTYARGKAVPSPIVPALVRTEQDRLLAATLGRPIWPWLRLATSRFPAIARVLQEPNLHA